MKRILVLSGKGGVGKSSIAGNIAVLLASRGHKVGWLDADLTSSSVMKLIGVQPKLPLVGKTDIKPFDYFGMKIMATSLFTESEEMPVFFKGERKREWMKQFISRVDWGDISHLVVDCPPGHSDEVIQLLDIFKNKIDAAVVVTTPSRLALNSVQKTIKILRKFGIKVTSMVVNYRYVKCPQCGIEISMFGASELLEFVKKYEIDQIFDIPFLVAQEKDPWAIRKYIGPVVDDILKWRLF